MKIRLNEYGIVETTSNEELGKMYVSDAFKCINVNIQNHSLVLRKLIERVETLEKEIKELKEEIR